jgi:PleD family two-component response regulator
LETWARIALAAGLLLVGYAATILRTRALKAQRRSLERRVASRTAELNAANARLIEISYVDALTGLATRRRLLETLDQNPRDTISAGVASMVIARSDAAHRLLRDADMALYQAKRDGRNRVRAHDETL